MNSFLALAAGIPFIILILGVIALVSIRYDIGRDALRVSILFITVRKVLLREIISAEFHPPHSQKRIGVFTNHGVVTITYDRGSPKSLTIAPPDPERFCEFLNEELSRLSS